MGTYGTFSNRPLYGGTRRREAFTVLVKNMFSGHCITKSTPTSTTNLPLDFLLCQVFHSHHLISSLHLNFSDSCIVNVKNCVDGA